MNQRPGVLRRQLLISGGVAGAAPLLAGMRGAPSPARKRESQAADNATDVTRAPDTASQCPSDVVITGLNIAIQPPQDILCQMGPASGPDAPDTLSLGFAVYSPARAFRFCLQGIDGNAILQYVETSNLPWPEWPTQPLYPDGVTWVSVAATGTVDTGVAHMDMQYDGNLVIYRSDGSVAWASNTSGNIQAFFRVQDDGNLLIWSQAGQVIWASNTSAGEAPGAGALKGL